MEHKAREVKMNWANLVEDAEARHHAKKQQKQFPHRPPIDLYKPERRQIKKFGDAKEGEQGVTVQGEQVAFELSRDKIKQREESFVTLDDKGEKIYWGVPKAEPSSFYQRLAQRTQDRHNQPADNSVAEPNVYLPPSRRTDRDRETEAALRVSNLPEDILIEDIRELCGRCVL